MTRAQATARIRSRLVEAAIGQLADEGMRGLTHRKVEQRAAVSQGLAKYHFGNLDGLIEAVLSHMVELELHSVMTVPHDGGVAASVTGEIPTAVWRRAREVAEEILGRPTLVRARFELQLHAAGRPELQQIIRTGRERFIARTAASLAAGDPRSLGAGAHEDGARMVLAMVDGLLLHQLSAPDGDAGDRTQVYLVAGALAALQVPELSGQARAARGTKGPRSDDA